MRRSRISFLNWKGSTQREVYLVNSISAQHVPPKVSHHPDVWINRIGRWHGKCCRIESLATRNIGVIDVERLTRNNCHQFALLHACLT